MLKEEEEELAEEEEEQQAEENEEAVDDGDATGKERSALRHTLQAGLNAAFSKVHRGHTIAAEEPFAFSGLPLGLTRSTQPSLIFIYVETTASFAIYY